LRRLRLSFGSCTKNEWRGRITGRTRRSRPPLKSNAEPHYRSALPTHCSRCALHCSLFTNPLLCGERRLTLAGWAALAMGDDEWPRSDTYLHRREWVVYVVWSIGTLKLLEEHSATVICKSQNRIGQLFLQIYDQVTGTGVLCVGRPHQPREPLQHRHSIIILILPSSHAPHSRRGLQAAVFYVGVWW